MLEPDFTNCITTEELARLFDEAFAKLHAGFADGGGWRKTPRVSVEGVGPLFVESYTARDVPLNCRAIITDVSADGLGIILPERVPVGAMLRMAIANEHGEKGLGFATVVFSDSCEGGFRAGLRFGETHQALDGQVTTTPASRWPALMRLKRSWAAAFRKIKRRQVAIRRIDRSVNGTHAELIVKAGLFHYTASLRVNGKKVASRSAVLHDRIRNLFCDSDPPTTVILTARGCSGRALLYTNAVGECGIDLSSS